eukprot:scaffold27615_cov139-Skeletonema_marinoi.AAC.14
MPAGDQVTSQKRKSEELPQSAAFNMLWLGSSSGEMLILGLTLRDSYEYLSVVYISIVTFPDDTQMTGTDYTE